MGFDFKNLKPYVRYSYINTSKGAANVYLKPLYAYDHRLFFVLEGRITALLEGEGSITLDAGDCLVFGPGQGYRITFGNVESRFVITSFDYDNVSYGTVSRRPDVYENFNPKEIYSDYTPPVFEDVLVCRGAFSLMEMLNRICSVMTWEEKYKFDCASGIMAGIIIELYRMKKSREKLKNANELSIKIKNYIDSKSGERITNERIGAYFGYHPYYINRVFKASFGVTLKDYIIDKRIDMAKSLLISTALSLEEIASVCGFSTPSYFSECFKARTGTRPSLYRNENSEGVLL